jgi:predicted transcriptional regulator
MGRPAFEPTAKARKFVASMAALGVRHDEIATLLEITPKTLRKHFRSELDRGVIEANAKVMQTLYRMASSGKNTAASIFWAKTRCGLRERRGPEEREEQVPQLVVRLD